LRQEDVRRPRGFALQVRVNLETLAADGSVRPSTGLLAAFDVPTGPGVRVDTAGYAGYRPSPSFDSLLAKVVARSASDDFPAAVAKAYRALCEFRVEGVATNLSFLRNLMRHPALAAYRVTTGFVDEHLTELLEGAAHPRRHAETAPATPRRAGATVDPRDPLAVLVHGKTSMPVVPEGAIVVRAPMQGTVVAIDVSPGDAVPAGAQLLVMEAMKMEHVVAAPVGGIVRALHAAAGDTVYEGSPLVVLEESAVEATAADDGGQVDLAHIRPDLAEVERRHAQTRDAARPDAVARRRRTGQRTARENVDDLCDPGTFVEYGPLVIAAQRRRRSVEELVARTPADGLVAGIGEVNGHRTVVLSYDYTVLAGTQGLQNHRKKDRLFGLAVSEGGGLGVYEPEAIGPMSVQVPNGVVDVAVADEGEAVAVAKRYLSYFQGRARTWECADQTLLRGMIPENRLRVYDVRQVIEALADVGSVLELRPSFGPGMVTALARIDGRALGVVANNPSHLGGAIDADGGDKAARFM